MEISFIISIAIIISPYFLKKIKSTQEIIGLVTTFGILGTFLGIFLGLYNFNVNDISSSVPELLSGLKTAFLTSIAGMSAGIILKIFPKAYGIKPEEKKAEIDMVEKMVELLYEITENQKNLFEEEKQQLKNIEKALCGDGDTTLLTQIQKLRTTFQDKQDEIIKEFRIFAEKMTENNIKALVEALNQVIRDFNTKLNEQFGENFKQLNEAVKELVVWQEQYKNQVEEMTKQFQRTLKGIQTCEEIIKEVVGEAAEFSAIANDLDNVLEGINEQKDILYKFLESLKKLIYDLPNLKPRIESLFEDIGKQIEYLMKQNSDLITNQINKLDKELEKALTLSLETLGSQLASLSNQFVQDYSPLTERLKEVVELALKVKTNESKI